MVRAYPERVTIRDVGPRDGLQPEAPVAVDERIRLVHALQDAGVAHIEVAAFVSPKAVPAMAGAAEVVAGIARRAGTTYAALVPNAKGAELALAAGVDELTVTISASETYNQRNVKMSTAESEAAIAAIVALADHADVPVDAVISCAFGSPYEGELAPAGVVALARRLEAAGVATTTYADTTGMATPRRIDDLVDALAGEVDRVGLHLHDTRGAALVNAYAALERGIARFDTSVGGLGGSPFAHGAGGNLATESLVAVLDDLEVATGIDLERLIAAAALVGELVGRPLASGVANHGPRTRLAAPRP
ncbi:hydroxymethylglutaryl-CoA lyase [Aquihabitans sp. G128]|uniref:hydroxymethylglutaryl-CoA lyase n=1 Tax=Aquihabitans sp. G128 TaxID=2849779 RepID=UPI001C2160D9|nr:hydroxymethylglutaryl-CoA lyase [Aquihabitans sp. G128]QXC62000.1 hydroxymethylglutaryl-CoA lyase [Aquihabitans sp. G128]